MNEVNRIITPNPIMPTSAMWKARARINKTKTNNSTESSAFFLVSFLLISFSYAAYSEKIVLILSESSDPKPASLYRSRQ